MHQSSPTMVRLILAGSQSTPSLDEAQQYSGWNIVMHDPVVKELLWDKQFTQQSRWRCSEYNTIENGFNSGVAYHDRNPIIVWVSERNSKNKINVLSEWSFPDRVGSCDWYTVPKATNFLGFLTKNLLVSIFVNETHKLKLDILCSFLWLKFCFSL